MPRAFPGATGFAALSRGAAGYSGATTVRKVTNLNDSGPGSLRDALVGDGSANNRDGTYVVFAVSGIIELTSIIRIRSNYITVLGQTSPGGIILAGHPVQVGYGAISGTEHYNNIIIRHLRHRAGNGVAGVSQPGATDQECFTVWGADDVLLNHLSMAWAGDEVSSVTEYVHTYANKRITYDKCIIGEGITDSAPEGNHNLGLLVDSTNTGAERTSVNVNRCYFTGVRYRTPYIHFYNGANGDIEVTNCAVWNWDGSHSPTRVSIAGAGRVRK